MSTTPAASAYTEHTATAHVINTRSFCLHRTYSNSTCQQHPQLLPTQNIQQQYMSTTPAASAYTEPTATVHVINTHSFCLHRTYSNITCHQYPQLLPTQNIQQQYMSSTPAASAYTEHTATAHVINMSRQRFLNSPQCIF